MVGILAITLVSPGATRMHAWPWSLGYAAALAAPTVMLLLRGSDRQRPLGLPESGWTTAALASAVAVMASALASPHQGPSVIWSAPLLAGVAAFFLLVDWLKAESRHRELLLRTALIAGTAIATVSMAGWLGQIPETSHWIDARNQHPLGHSNYTAGLALLLLPLAARSIRHEGGTWRVLASLLGALALLMLFTSGSRGGWIGLAVMLAAALAFAPWSLRARVSFGAAAGAVILITCLAHPRTRAAMLGGTEVHPLAVSDKQRLAMITAAARMGGERPWLGWGPGTTPLVYPSFRGGLAGGAENVLQLHSLPAQLWAELGLGGIVTLLAFAGLAWRDSARQPVARATLLGYGTFALTDWQLDVPVFSLGIAMYAALVATGASLHPTSRLQPPRPRPTARAGVTALAMAGLLMVAAIGRSDPTPEMNVRAMILAREPRGIERAVELLRESLALNDRQEIAHFNLGWILLTREPAEAERHFRAASRLVPDKGGVYFGLGLARLNQGDRHAAALALALECLNNPPFLTSPWWREPAIAVLREDSASAFRELLAKVTLTGGSYAGMQPERLGRSGEGPERAYQNERPGYPVLMRNLDLPIPRDLYDVRESIFPPEGHGTVPPKGWLAGPTLLELLAETIPPRK